MDRRCRGKGRQVGLYPGSHRDSPADDGGDKSLRGDQLQLYMKLRMGKQEEFL
jgi:hypothetical protein